MTILALDKVSMQFGGLLAVNEVSFSVPENIVFAVIGPNGAGKTTLFNCISGFYAPTQGAIHFHDTNIAAKSSHQIARKGLVRTFQNIRLFKEMTVVENLMVAQHELGETDLFKGIFKTPGFIRRDRECLERAKYWMNAFELTAYANMAAGTLSYGQQRRVEIARCMATQPRMLLLDEPAAGLNPAETQELDQLILQLKEQHKLSILLIEHDMRLVMAISDRVAVLDQGGLIALGNPNEIQANERVIKAYLGEE